MVCNSAPVNSSTESVDIDSSTNNNSTDNIVNATKKSRSVSFRVWKNIVILSLTWLCVYSGVSPMSSVQSSLNAGSGIGTLSLSIRDCVKLLSSLLINNFLITKLGPKKMILMGTLMCSTFMAANYYPVWGTMAPAAALYGFGLNSMWIAQNFYIGKAGLYYSEHTDIPRRTINVRLFGTFYGIYYWNHAIGNVVSSLILGAASPIAKNFTYDPMDICGAQFCNDDLGVSFIPSGNSTVRSLRPDNSKVYGLCGFCIGAVLLGTLVATIFLDDLPQLIDSEKKEDIKTDKESITEEKSKKSSWRLLANTIVHLRHPRILLLIPLFTYNGFDDSFIGTELTKAFVTCSIGVEYVGFVSTLFGVFCPLSALACGWFNNPKTRFFPFILFAMAHLSCVVGMFYWTAASPTITMYVFSAVWGIGSGVVGSQSSAICNVVFPNKLESTISNLQVFAGIGGMFFFGISSILCTYVKLYILSAFIICAVVGVGIVEIIVHLEHKNDKQHEAEANIDKASSAVEAISN